MSIAGAIGREGAAPQFDGSANAKVSPGINREAFRLICRKVRLTCRDWVRRQWSRRSTAHTEKLRLVHSLGLGERRTVFVLAAEGRRFLVGSTPQSVTLLAELSSDGPSHLPGFQKPVQVPQPDVIQTVLPAGSRQEDVA